MAQIFAIDPDSEPASGLAPSFKPRDTDGALLRLNDASETLPTIAPDRKAVAEPGGAQKASRSFLIVTAPFGRFARELAKALNQDGALCTRVLLNAGDLWDWGPSSTAPFFGGIELWKNWLRSHIAERKITDLVLFGGANAYCADAVAVGRELGLRIFCLEEGYFRPNWITLEEGGVNGFSSLPRNTMAYDGGRPALNAVEHVPVGPITPALVRNIVVYHLAIYLGAPAFKRYKAGYQYSAARQAVGHTIRYVSQRLSQKKTRALLNLELNRAGRLFVALLQRPGDSQLTAHSPLKSPQQFIEHVMASFAAHAPSDSRLLFKSHPLDHGLERHDRIIAREAARLGLEGRVCFVDDGHLPSLLRACSGVISVNSTAGLMGLELGRPTIALGTAIYAVPGLTHQGGLASFWTEPEFPDPDLFARFRAVTMQRTQINGAFSTAFGVSLAVPEVARRLLAPPRDAVARFSPSPGQGSSD